jgi:pumilio family protein 6
MPGIKRKEPQSQTASQSPPKKFKKEDGDKKVKRDDGDKKFKHKDGEKKFKKDGDKFGKKDFKREEDGEAKVPVAKELYDGRLPDRSMLRQLTPPLAQSSKEAHAKQKAVAKERKAARPNADSIARAKKLWEQLRLKSHVDKEKRSSLVTELFDLLTGNVKEYVFKHDSVRPVQCAIKYATVEQKKSIAKELQGTYRELAESRYAKFLVAKLLVEDKEIREMIISEFYGSVKRMINHPEASWILDDTYRQVASPKQKAILLREWYGPEYSIENKNMAGKPEDKSQTITADLAAILATSPEKRKPTTEHLYQMINSLVQKNLSGFTMLHDAMLQYSLVLSPTDSEKQTELLDLLKPTEESDTDLLKNLAYTASGARLVRRTLAHCTAKDRKLILKPFKDMVESLALDIHGHTILLAALEVVDDTVLVSKFIFPSLLAAQKPDEKERTAYILDVANSPTARTVLLAPLLPVPSGAEDGASKAPKWTFPASAEAVTELRTLRAQLGTSKKDPEVRRQELGKALLTQSDSILITAVATRAKELCATTNGCQVAQEVLLGAPAALGMDGKAGEQIHAAMVAVADLAKGDPSKEGHIAQDGSGGRMLKTLVSGARYDPATKTSNAIEPALGFADVLFERIKAHLTAWATGASSFVVANLFEETSHFGAEMKKEAIKILKNDSKKLEAARGSGNKGAAMVLDALK